jgi:hypothetical protein
VEAEETKMAYARDSYEIVQRQIEREFAQNEQAELFFDATDDILRNEELPKVIRCPSCDEWVEAELDGTSWIGNCECGHQFTEEVSE